jgi:hypothetical protein
LLLLLLLLLLLPLLSNHSMKRVKSFPIIPDEEDVAAAVDQTSKAAKKAAKKVAQQMVSLQLVVRATMDVEWSTFKSSILINGCGFSRCTSFVWAVMWPAVAQPVRRSSPAQRSTVQLAVIVFQDSCRR